MPCAMNIKTTAKPVVARGFAGPSTRQAQSIKAPRTQAAKEMMTWTPINNKFFETFSFLPPLDDGEIARQVDYIIANGWTPCLEFAEPDCAYVQDKSQIRFGNSASAGYYDNRYWTMWKLPLFGCNDAEQVLDEMGDCQNAFPNCYIRLVAFDSVTQTQMIGFLVNRPRNAKEFQKAESRSVS